jgi:hypothetical protein
MLVDEKHSVENKSKEYQAPSAMIQNIYAREGVMVQITQDGPEKSSCNQPRAVMSKVFQLIGATSSITATVPRTIMKVNAIPYHEIYKNCFEISFEYHVNSICNNKNRKTICDVMAYTKKGDPLFIGMELGPCRNDCRKCQSPSLRKLEAHHDNYLSQSSSPPFSPRPKCCDLLFYEPIVPISGRLRYVVERSCSRPHELSLSLPTR